MPCFARWPGKFEAGKALNGSSPTRSGCLPCSPRPASQISSRSSRHQAGEKTFHVHIDGFNTLPYLTGETDKCPRNWFFYVNDDGDLTAMRIGDWKIVYMEHAPRPCSFGRNPS